MKLLFPGRTDVEPNLTLVGSDSPVLGSMFFQLPERINLETVLIAAFVLPRLNPISTILFSNKTLPVPPDSVLDRIDLKKTFLAALKEVGMRSNPKQPPGFASYKRFKWARQEKEIMTNARLFLDKMARRSDGYMNVSNPELFVVVEKLTRTFLWTFFDLESSQPRLKIGNPQDVLGFFIGMIGDPTHCGYQPMANVEYTILSALQSVSKDMSVMDHLQLVGTWQRVKLVRQHAEAYVERFVSQTKGTDPASASRLKDEEVTFYTMVDDLLNEKMGLGKQMSHF